MRIYLLSLMLLTGCVSHPSNWQTYDAGRFSFVMPSDLKKTWEGGIDSYVCEIQSPEMSLFFDDGLYSGDPFDTQGELPSFKSHHESIDSHDVQIASFDRDPSNHVIIVNFIGFGLTMSANCKTTADCQTATQIFRTIRFK